MTFPLFRPALENSHPAAIAVGARVHGTPAALGLAVQRDADRAELLSLYVEPSFRQRGFGTELLHAIEIAAKERGCAQLDAGRRGSFTPPPTNRWQEVRASRRIAGSYISFRRTVRK